MSIFEPEVIVRDKSGRAIIGLDANDELDLYLRERFTWTPVLGGSGGTSGQTYAFQSGTGIRIGGLIWWAARLALTAKGTITGNAQLQGLPYVNAFQAPATILMLNLLANKVSTEAMVPAGAQACALYGKAAAAASATLLVTADISDTTELYASGIFREF